MSAPALSANYFAKRSTDELIAARERLQTILDDRARQVGLFDPPPAPVLVPPPPAARVLPEVLSPSVVNTFNECEAKWYYRKVLRLPEVRTGALVLGSAFHEAIAENFRQKLETFEDLPYAGVRPVFLESLAKQFDEGDVRLDPEETVEELIDCGSALVRVYLEQAAPGIQPAAVELPVEGEIGGVKVRGIVDCLGSDGTIHDFKTAGKRPSRFPANHRLQVTTYAAITPGANGSARLDTITKTKTVHVDQRTIDITPADVLHAERLYSITLEQMQTGLVKPNRGSFMCSRKHCPYVDACVADYGGEVD